MAHAPSTTLASLDGAVAPADEVRVPVTDDGLLRGDGVFEAVRLYAGRPFALAAHLDRLEHSGANLRLGVDRGAVEADVVGLLAAAGEVDALLRIVLTRGGRRLALVEPLPPAPVIARLACVTFAPVRVLDQIKSLSYGANMLCSRLAHERGFDDALLVTPHGRVLEAPTSSVFWAHGGELFTPPLSDHILASITRALVIELTGAREAPCPLAEIEAADEVFLASTTREVQAVGAVEATTYAAPGALTGAAREAIRAHIAADLALPPH